MKKLLLSLSLLALIAVRAKATVVFSDSFDYANGALTAVAPGIWNAHGSSGGMIVTNGQLQVTSSLSEDDNALLSGQPYTTNSAAVLYSAFKVKFTALPTAGGAYFAHFKDTNSGAATGFGARIWVAATNITDHVALPAGTFRIGIGNGAGATNISFGGYTNTLSTNVVYTVVTRFVPSTGVSTLWVNPTAESDPSVTATDVGTTARPNPINVVAYAFRQASGEGTMLIDDLKVSTVFNDIAGANTSPSISSISTQNTPANTQSAAIPFNVSDAESAASDLTVSGTSANQTLVPDANIAFGGANGSRTVTLTPAGGQQGSALISVSVSDGTNVTTTQFTLTVGAPSISPIANQITSSNQPVTVAFTVNDSETDPLTVTTSSSDTNLAPNANIILDGSTSNRTLTITPAPGLTGNTTITVSVSDGFNVKTTRFVLTVKVLYGLVFFDDFTYPDGSLFQNSLVWKSHSGTISQMIVSNGVAVINSALSEDLNASLTNQPFAAATGVILYCSFVLSNSVLPTASGNYFLHYKDSGTTFRAKVFASTANAASGMFRLGINNTGNNVTAADQFPLDLALDQNYTVLTRYNVGTGESRLWVNPNSENDASVAASDAPIAATVIAIALREDTGMGVVNIDDLRIGTSYTDVLTVTNVVVPVLSATLSGGSVLISWATNATGFTLESTPSLTSPITWSPAGSPTPSGSNNVVTIISPTDNQFYRLRK